MTVGPVVLLVEATLLLAGLSDNVKPGGGAVMVTMAGEETGMRCSTWLGD
jgi:hypothetical protein